MRSGCRWGASCSSRRLPRTTGSAPSSRRRRARSYREETHRTGGSPLETAAYLVLTGATRVFSDERVPPDLDGLVDDIAPRSVLFVYGEQGQPQEIDLNPTYFASAREPKQIWEVPGAGHIEALATDPEEYERRVIGFFDGALVPDRAGRAPGRPVPRSTPSSAGSR